jgi:hypothetical protein
MGERDKAVRAARAERLPGLQQRYPGWSIRLGLNGWYARPKRTGGLFREIHASHSAELAVMMRGQDVLRTRLSHAVAEWPSP